MAMMIMREVSVVVYVICGLAVYCILSNSSLFLSLSLSLGVLNYDVNVIVYVICGLAVYSIVYCLLHLSLSLSLSLSLLEF